MFPPDHSRSRSRSRCVRLLVLPALLMMSGCGTMNRSRLDDCTRRIEAYQVESAQLKDEALGLRSKNRDLAQRAVQDARQLRTLEESNRNLERSVVAYQQERDEMAAAFEDIQRLVRVAGRPGPSAAAKPVETRETVDPYEPLEAFARAHPGSRFDRQSGLWSFPAVLLFEPGSDQPIAGADLLVQALGRLMAELDPTSSPIRIVGRIGTSAVQRTSAETPPAPPTDLGQARAQHVRDILATHLAREPESIALEVEVIDRETTNPENDASPPGDSIEVYLAKPAEIEP